MKSKVLYLLFMAYSVAGQVTIQEVDNWIRDYPFADYSKKDSMLLWSKQLNEAAIKLNYSRAAAYAFRFKGLYFDYSDQPEEAIKYYFDFLTKTKSYGNLNDEMTATGDLVYVYTTTNQHHLAKPLILKFTNYAEKQILDTKKLSTFYNNLGIIYRNENKVDSAVLAYNESLKLKEKLNDLKGISNLKINLTALYIHQKKYKEALKLTDENIEYLLENENKADLWNNYINKAGALDGLKRFNEAKISFNKALYLAKELKSKKLEQVTLEQLSSFYSNQRDFTNAYDYLTKSNELKALLINEETTEKIAGLQEKYNADERERENQLLNAQIESQKSKQISFWLAIGSLIIILTIVAIALIKNKKKNLTIEKQNQKLIQLNSEKNELISIVSHDLASPFTTIKMWLNTINEKSSSSDWKEAKKMILKTVDFGLFTIKKILTIDKDEIKPLNLEKIDIAELLKNLKETFTKETIHKNINLKVKVLQDFEYFVSDQNLITRALQNLISNAIKFSPENSEIILTSRQENQNLVFDVEDFGCGITEEELPKLFNKYNKLSNIPTHNEDSNGLGLSIVKRISEELGGTITVDSTPNKGSKFSLRTKI